MKRQSENAYIGLNDDRDEGKIFAGNRSATTVSQKLPHDGERDC